jgi:hypothetical protein
MGSSYPQQRIAGRPCWPEPGTKQPGRLDANGCQWNLCHLHIEMDLTRRAEARHVLAEVFVMKVFV